MSDSGRGGGGRASGSDSGSWTLLLLRDGDPEGRRWRPGRMAWLAVAGLGLLLVVVGGGLGAWWARADADEEVRRLRERVAALQSERDRLVRVSSRLETVERSYERLRRAMAPPPPEESGGEANRGVLLPALDSAAGPGADRAGTGPPPAQRDDLYHWPLAREGFVTRRHRTGPAGEPGHPGIDIAVPTGSYVRAVRAGVVLEAQEDPVYGRYVRILHADGVRSLYGHNSWLFVSPGDSVEAREVIALTGNTGQSTAPHLHFEAERAGRPMDPAELVAPSG